MFRQEVTAALRSVFLTISSFYSNQEEAAQYTDKIETWVIDEESNARITLTEVLVDFDTFAVSGVIESDQKLEIREFDEIASIEDLKINGSKVDVWAYSSKTKNADENSLEFVFMLAHELPLNEQELTEGIDVSMNIHLFGSTTDGSQQGNHVIEETAVLDFKFNTESASLVENTQYIEIDQQIELSDGNTIIIDGIRTNTLGASIYYTTDIGNRELSENSLELRGYDDLGNTLYFYNAIGFKDGAEDRDRQRFILSDTKQHTILDSEASSVTLRLYSSSSSRTEDRETLPIGDPINVSLK